MTIESEKNAPSARATLADVRPGGRVRLGDQVERARFEAWASEHNYSVAMDGEQYEFAAARLMWKAWRAAFASGAAAAVTGTVLVNMGDSEAEFIRANDEEAALSAQPSPGGQDVLAALQQDYDKLLDSFNRQVEVAEKIAGRALQQDDRIEELEEALAARQPVGEPVGRVRTRVDGGFIAELLPGVADRLSNMAPLYLHQPAQAVDLDELRRLSDGWLARSDRLSVTQQRKAGAYWACAKELRDWLDSKAVGNG